MLCKILKAHIVVENFSSVKSMKYITKYDSKGRDMATFATDDEGEQDIVCNYAHILWEWTASSSLGSYQKSVCLRTSWIKPDYKKKILYNVQKFITNHSVIFLVESMHLIIPCQIVECQTRMKKIVLNHEIYREAN